MFRFFFFKVKLARHESCHHPRKFSHAHPSQSLPPRPEATAALIIVLTINYSYLFMKDSDWLCQGCPESLRRFPFLSGEQDSLGTHDFHLLSSSHHWLLLHLTSNTEQSQSLGRRRWPALGSLLHSPCLCLDLTTGDWAEPISHCVPF